MKKILFALLTVLLMITAVSCKKNEESAVPDGMFYEENEDDIDYRIYFPDNWIIDRNDGGMTSARVPEALVGEETDKSNVSVTAFAPSETMSIDDYINTEYKERIKSSYPDCEIIEDFSAEAGVTLGDRDARRIVFTTDIGGTKYQVMQIVTVYKGYIYMLTYTATQENYPFHEEDVQSIVKYFEFV